MKFNKPCKYIKKISWNTNKLFIDSDRDGVANVFDCQPFNKRKQDKEQTADNMFEMGFTEDAVTSELERQDKEDIQFKKVPQAKTDAMLTKLTKSERFNRRKI